MAEDGAFFTEIFPPWGTDLSLCAAFDDVAEAAQGYAYLTGFLLQVLADTAYDGSVSRAAAAVRRLIAGRG